MDDWQIAHKQGQIKVVMHAVQYCDAALLSHHWLRLLIALTQWSTDLSVFAYGFFGQSYLAQLRIHYCRIQYCFHCALYL